MLSCIVIAEINEMLGLCMPIVGYVCGHMVMLSDLERQRAGVADQVARIADRVRQWVCLMRCMH